MRFKYLFIDFSGSQQHTGFSLRFSVVIDIFALYLYFNIISLIDHILVLQGAQAPEQAQCVRTPWPCLSYFS